MMLSSDSCIYNSCSKKLYGFYGIGVLIVRF